MAFKMDTNIPFNITENPQTRYIPFVSVSFKSSEVTTFGGKGPMPLCKTEYTALADFFDTLPSTLTQKCPTSLPPQVNAEFLKQEVGWTNLRTQSGPVVPKYFHLIALIYSADSDTLV